MKVKDDVEYLAAATDMNFDADQRAPEEYPKFKVYGPKNHTLNGVWDQSPQILGTWTL